MITFYANVSLLSCCSVPWTLCHQSQLEITSSAPSPTLAVKQPFYDSAISIVYLRKISVSNLTFIALLPSEGVATEAAARVDVALLGHRADHAAAAILQTDRQEI